MKGAGNHFLAGGGCSFDEHRAASLGNVSDRLEHCEYQENLLLTIRTVLS
jgi:hypothetical protein